MIFQLEFVSNWSSKNPLDRPKEYLSNLPDELYFIFIDEIRNILHNPFTEKRTHELREPWVGFLSWYPDSNSKLKDYRIIYRVNSKVRIYRLGHHSEVYKK